MENISLKIMPMTIFLYYMIVNSDFFFVHLGRNFELTKQLIYNGIVGSHKNKCPKT